MLDDIEDKSVVVAVVDAQGAVTCHSRNFIVEPVTDRPGNVPVDVGSAGPNEAPSSEIDFGCDRVISAKAGHAIDPMTLRAAALSGASPFQAFRRILLPLTLPGIAAGGLMVFVMTLGYFVTPALLGGTSNMMLAEMIAQLIQSLLNWGLGSAAAFILLIATMALYALQLRLVGARRATGGI